MNRYVIYGIVTLVFVMLLVASFDRSQLNTLRSVAGLDPLYISETDVGDEARMEALEALTATPVPGMMAEDAITLGQLADEAVGCVVDLGGRRPNYASVEGLRRYFLVLAATGAKKHHAIVEPKLRPLYSLIGRGPMAVLETAEQGLLSDRESTLLAEFHEAYSNPDHPMYDGLGLYGGTFDGLDFEAMTDAVSVSWQEIAACTVERGLPPLAEWQPLEVE